MLRFNRIKWSGVYRSASQPSGKEKKKGGARHNRDRGAQIHTHTQSPGTEVPYIHGQKILYRFLFLFQYRSLWLAIEMDLSTSSLNFFLGCICSRSSIFLGVCVCTPPLKSRGSERGKKKRKKKSCAEQTYISLSSAGYIASPAACVVFYMYVRTSVESKCRLFFVLYIVPFMSQSRPPLWTCRVTHPGTWFPCLRKSLSTEATLAHSQMYRTGGGVVVVSRRVCVARQHFCEQRGHSNVIAVVLCDVVHI